MDSRAMPNATSKGANMHEGGFPSLAGGIDALKALTESSSSPRPPGLPSPTSAFQFMSQTSIDEDLQLHPDPKIVGLGWHAMAAMDAVLGADLPPLDVVEAALSLEDGFVLQDIARKVEAALHTSITFKERKESMRLASFTRHLDTDMRFSLRSYRSIASSDYSRDRLRDLERADGQQPPQQQVPQQPPQQHSQQQQQQQQRGETTRLGAGRRTGSMEELTRVTAMRRSSMLSLNSRDLPADLQEALPEADHGEGHHASTTSCPTAPSSPIASLRVHSPFHYMAMSSEQNLPIVEEDLFSEEPDLPVARMRLLNRQVSSSMTSASSPRTQNNSPSPPSHSPVRQHLNHHLQQQQQQQQQQPSSPPSPVPLPPLPPHPLQSVSILPPAATQQPTTLTPTQTMGLSSKKISGLVIRTGSVIEQGEWTTNGWASGCGSPHEVYIPSQLQQIRADDLVKVRELGRGCFGSVWLARWRGVDVALKELHCQATDTQQQEVFYEAERLASLRHPCILHFYGIVTSPDCYATVVEYMRMGSLRRGLQKLKQQGITMKRLKAAIAAQAARGMEYLHGQSVVHFDLKCDNLLCDLRDLVRPVVKIGDLGLSKQKKDSFIAGNMRGTLPWMAPELFPGNRLDSLSLDSNADPDLGEDRVNEKVDVFSWGICMWEIWTLGEQPYRNLPISEIFPGVLTGSLRPDIPDDCDPKWAQLMQECWSPSPRARPSFSEIADRLDALGERWKEEASGSSFILQNFHSETFSRPV